ncbi:benzoate/H(+) symporter BenE family transporter (plasmid) [Aggregatilineales bacterium SYSU G02658]
MTTDMIPPRTNFVQNVRDFPRALSLSGALAGFLVVITGYTGPLLLVTAAADAANLSPELTASWILSIAMGNGLMTILQSFYYRQPIIAPWSTAGVALLITTLPTITIGQAVGAYIACAVGVALVGVSGLFGRMMRLVPLPVVSGLLAGILFNFGRGVYAALGQANEPVLFIMVSAMIFTFFLMKRFGSRAPTLAVMIVGGVIAAVGGQIQFEGLELTLTRPVFIAPEFDLNIMLTLGVPLMALALTSQYAPGDAVLRTSGYDAPINGVLRNTGLASVLIALFGGHGATLGALTAAMVASPESQPDPDRRYASSVVSGILYVVFGMFGTTIFAFFAGFPKLLVDVVAGLALTGTIVSGLAAATLDPKGRDAGIAAFFITVSGITLLGIAAPFWGLIFGMGIYALLNKWK